MKPHGVVLAAAIVLAPASMVTPAGAGRFTGERGCDTLSTNPLRILLRFELLNTRNYGDLCAVWIRPVAAYGVPINPILGCVTSSILTCTIDSAGVAIFSADPCVPNNNWGIGSPPSPAAWDSLGLVVGAPAGYYGADLIIPGGGVGAADFLQFDCQPGTQVSVPGEAPIAFALDPVRPDPARGSALVVQFTLPSAAPASLELLDVAGRRVSAREVGQLGAGRHKLDFGAGRGLAPGIYVVRLQQGTNVKVVRAALLE